MALDDLPVTITLPEFMRRMKDMQATGGGPMMFGDLPMSLSVAVNANHALTRKILDYKKEQSQIALAKQVYDLALLAQGMLRGERLTQFINRSVEIAGK
jgi:molecular chaperone HtpG